MNNKLPWVTVMGLLQLACAGCGGGGDKSPAPASDTIPPTVVIVTPANGAMNAAINTTASVNFSEPIDCATVTANSITVTTGGAPVPGTLSCSGSSATFTPTGSLALSTTYTFSIGRGVRDPAGNALSSEFVSTFSTAAAPPAPTYTISGTVSGLAAGAGVTLQNKGADNLTLNANGSFAFSTAIAGGNSYDVTVLNVPAGYSCAVGNGSGTVVSADITDVTVTCSLLPLPSATALSVSYALKQLKFNWSAASGATFYRLMSTPDGLAEYARVGGDLTGTTATVDVAVHLIDWVNARYRVDACNVNGCVPSVAIAAADGLTNSAGYFKASNTGAHDLAGAIAVSGDGNTLAIGAPGEASNAMGVDGDETNNSSVNAGAVYIYLRTSSGWLKQAYLKAPNTNLAGAHGRFGFSLALSRDGNTLAVGAPGEAGCASGIDSPTVSIMCSLQGAVYIFIRSSSGWEYRNYLKGTPPAAYTGLDVFGYSVALSADGNTLIAGAPGDTWAATGIIQGSNAVAPPVSYWGGHVGAAYVFTRSAGIWSQEAYIKPLFIVPTYANNGSQELRFGMDVAISSDGDSAAIGAPGESSGSIVQNVYDCAPASLSNCSMRSGAVYLFRRTRANTTSPWAQQALIKLAGTPSELAFGGYSTTGVGRPWTSLSGTLDFAPSAHVLSLTADGNMLAVGSLRVGDPPYKNVPAVITRPASVDLFTFTQQMVWEQQTTLQVDPAPFSNASEGSAVSVVLSADGSLLAAGRGYVFSRSGGSTWSRVSKLNAAFNIDDDFGWSLGMSEDGHTLAISQPLNASNATGIGGDQSDHSVIDAGAVYLY